MTVHYHFCVYVPSFVSHTLTKALLLLTRQRRMTSSNLQPQRHHLPHLPTSPSIVLPNRGTDVLGVSEMSIPHQKDSLPTAKPPQIVHPYCDIHVLIPLEGNAAHILQKQISYPALYYSNGCDTRRTWLSYDLSSRYSLPPEKHFKKPK